MTRAISQESLSTLCIDEILSHIRDVIWKEERPVKVYVGGDLKEDIVKSLTEDYFSIYEGDSNAYVFVDDNTEADLLLIQKSKPYRQCTHVSGDFKAVGIFWQIDLRVMALGHKADNRCFIWEERNITEDNPVDLWEYLSDELAEHMREQDIRGASIDEIELESERLGWDRIITRREGGIGFTKKIRRAVCSKAKRKLRGRVAERSVSSSIEVSEGWLGLRELANALCVERGFSLRDSTICSHYIVPEEAGMSKVDLRKSLLEGDLKTLRIKQPAFNDIIRRKVSKKGSTITNTDLGRLGEAFTHRLLSPSVECWVGPESAGVCDISDKSSGDPAKATWALNVKVSLEDEVNRSFEVSPEHQVSKSWVLLIMPRLLMMRLYPITGEQMTINSSSGGLCVTPEELAERFKELIES